MMLREPNGVNRHGHIPALLLLFEELVELLEPLVVPTSLAICEEHHHKFRAWLSILLHCFCQNVKTWEEIGTSSHDVVVDMLKIGPLIIGHRWISIVIVEDRVYLFKQVLALVAVSAEDDLGKVEAGLFKRLKWSSLH